MATKVTRVISSDEDKLLELCGAQTNCSDCEISNWTNIFPPNQSDREAPENTITIVVDVTRRLGAIRIFEARNDEYPGGVGNEDAGFVIVPWNSSWNYSCAGTLRVAYIIKKKQ